MNKILTTAVLLLVVRPAIAQKGIDNLIQAEKDFAAYSVAHSTKEAFQQFIDSNSIMFDKGQPVKAIEFWNKREKRPGVLNWHPQYAEISASEDFGYTTGPWTFQNSINDSVIARGQYSTVWHLNKNGEWKFLVDFGIDNTQLNDAELRILDAPKQPEWPKNADLHLIIPHIEPLVAAENAFNKLFEKKRSKAYKLWLSGQSILTRTGFLPAANSAERKVFIDSTPAGIKFRMNGWGESAIPNTDMGYTYGTTFIHGKIENYMRIWRREKNGWKIAVEVLRY